MVDAFAKIAEELFVAKLQRVLGVGYESKLECLLLAVRETHRAISTERLSSGLTVAIALTPDSALLPKPSASLTSAMELTSRHGADGPISVQVEDDRTIRYWEEPVDEYQDHFLYYVYRGAFDEVLIANGNAYPVPTLPDHPSYFGVPYFLHLRDALIHYDTLCARRSDCEHLVKCWRDGSRIIFAPKPEKHMRRSLVRFLRLCLRGSKIMPEQNVDETHPVDIKVTSLSSNRVALIEVKWLGMSAEVDATTHTVNWGEPRARTGATQLCEYLDTYHVESPTEETRGVLTVFDGRRANVTAETTSLDPADAGAFEHSEIDYREIGKERTDFEEIRFFCTTAG